MKSISYKVNDPLGLHARPAGLFVKEAAAFKSKIMIKCGEKEVDAKRIMGVMSLGAKQGSEIIVTCEGEDENQAADALAAFLAKNL